MKEADEPSLLRKRYLTIGEVSKLCHVRDHVLRYWEEQFPKLKPIRRQGRRYYQHEDVVLIQQIRQLTQDEGYTLEGVRQKLSGDKADQQKELLADTEPPQDTERAQVIRKAVSELEAVVALLQE